MLGGILRNPACRLIEPAGVICRSLAELGRIIVHGLCSMRARKRISHQDTSLRPPDSPREGSNSIGGLWYFNCSGKYS